MKKTLLILLVILITAALLTPVVLADETVGDRLRDAASDNGDSEDLENKTDRMVTNAVDFVRDLAKLGAVVFIIWSGIIIWFNGRNAQAIAQARVQLLLFVVAMFLIYSAESIVAKVFQLFGWV